MNCMLKLTRGYNASRRISSLAALTSYEAFVIDVNVKELKITRKSARAKESMNRVRLPDIKEAPKQSKIRPV